MISPRPPFGRKPALPETIRRRPAGWPLPVEPGVATLFGADEALAAGLAEALTPPPPAPAQ